MGNLRSVKKKFDQMNVPTIVTSDQKEIEKASKIILPGVGHFANGMQKIKDLNILEMLNYKVLEEKIPILGICLGMQLFGKHSEEGNVSGLGWIDAEIVRFNVSDKLKFKIPHMGWNSVEIAKENQLFKNIPNETLFYFVHSYHMICNDLDTVIGITNYDYSFTSIINKDNIYGTQFHPEKSHKLGEQILKNFSNL